MKVYRPVSCTGLAGAPCTACLRFTQQATPYEALAMPELRDGKCSDYIPGRRPVVPRPAPAAAEGSEA